MTAADLPPLPFSEFIRYQGPDAPTRPAHVIVWVFPSGIGVSLIENQRDHAWSFGVFVTGKGAPHPHLSDVLFVKCRLTGLDNEETGPPFAPYWHHIPLPGVTADSKAMFARRLAAWLERVRTASPAELLA